jgi:serine protease inhibitor
MWFILPNSGKTTEDVLVNGQYLDMLLGNWENTKYARVNLSVPKFDIEAKKDLKEGLMEMGITDLFCLGTADFSASLKVPAFISAANQAVRIAIDETGVTAAAYFELPAPGEAMPPEEIIDFILDRPFLVFITDSTGIPLFAGSVQQP